MNVGERLWKARRAWFKERWKRMLRGKVATFLAGQSRVGDPTIFKSETFPWAVAMEDEAVWRAIREEALEILALREHLPNFQEISPDQQRISPDDKWKIFFLQGFGYRCARNLERCPETARQLKRIPGLETAFFSILAPGKRVKPHRGITKGLIRCHLPLIIPGDSDRCGMRLGREVVGWDEGRMLIFDDTLKHSVWNDTDDYRVVLLFDVRRPMKLPGRVLTDALIRALRTTSFVRDARANEALWEANFYASQARSFSTSIADTSGAVAPSPTSPNPSVPGVRGSRPAARSEAQWQRGEAGRARDYSVRHRTSPRRV